MVFDNYDHTSKGAIIHWCQVSLSELMKLSN